MIAASQRIRCRSRSALILPLADFDCPILSVKYWTKSAAEIVSRSCRSTTTAFPISTSARFSLAPALRYVAAILAIAPSTFSSIFSSIVCLLTAMVAAAGTGVTRRSPAVQLGAVR